MYRRSTGCGVLRTISENRSQPHSERKSSEDTIVGETLSEVTLVDSANMAETTATKPEERKRSFGIGGAGNIRSEADLKDRIEKEMEKAANRSRRSSVRSNASSKAGSIVERVLRRGSKSDETAVEG